MLSGYLFNVTPAPSFQVLSSPEPEPEEVSSEAAGWSGERVTLQWANGRRATIHVVVAHAHLKLLCYGPSCC